MKKILYIAAVFTAIAVITACSKDQKVVKELEGTWTVTAVSYNGLAEASEAFAGQEYTFTKCKVKKDPCDGTYTYNDPTKGATDLAFTYSIAEKGTEFSMTMSIFGLASETTTSTIDEHSDSKFVFSFTEDGVVTKTTLTKK